MNQLIDAYYTPVFHSVARLTGLADQEELKALTMKILDQLRDGYADLAAESRKGVFIYKVVLAHVFSYLEERGDLQRINYLQRILLIHPSQYLKGTDNKNPPPGTSQQGDIDI